MGRVLLVTLKLKRERGKGVWSKKDGRRGIVPAGREKKKISVLIRGKGGGVVQAACYKEGKKNQTRRGGLIAAGLCT